MQRSAAIAFLLFLVVAGTDASAAPESGWKKLRVRFGVLPASDVPLSFRFKVARPLEDGTLSGFGISIAVTKGESGEIAYTIGDKRKTLRRLPAMIKFDDENGEERAVLLRDSGGILEWSPHFGAVVTIGRDLITFTDLNLDGRISAGKAGEDAPDAFYGPNSFVACPFAGTVWTEQGAYDVRFDYESGRRPVVSARKLPSPVEGRKDVAGALSLWNTWRQRAGVVPVEWDASLVDGCRKHAEYMDTNSAAGHGEDPSKPGYTPEGARAGANSVVSTDMKKDATDAMLTQLRTAYHAERLLNPAVEASAIAIAGEYFICDVMSRRRKVDYSGDIIYVWPPPGSTGVFTSFALAREHPMPVSGAASPSPETLGQVVMVRLNASKKADGPFELVLTDSRSAPVEGYFTCPGTAPGGYNTRNDELIILLPEKHLKKKTTYRAAATIGEGEERLKIEWSFST